MARHQAANDNHIVGLGNIHWRPPETPDMSPAEVRTLCKPFNELHEMIAEATSIVNADKTGRYGGAIYVISDIYGHLTKIGKAMSPLDRLAQLQTGNPSKLFIHRVFWLANDGSRWLTQAALVDRIERDSHRSAEVRYERLEGEWFRCSPSDAHDVVYEVIGREPSVKKCCVMTPLRDIWRAA